jgi:hypothetical protein
MQACACRGDVLLRMDVVIPDQSFLLVVTYEESFALFPTYAQR